MTMIHVPLSHHAAATRLTADEQIVLDRCEQMITAALETFVNVGQALQTIRDAKLYRATHPSFAAYCPSRWDISCKRAYQLIAAAGIAVTIAQHGLQPPTNERQARALTGLSPNEQVAA